MAKLGILCEKPSAAKNFATALGGRSGVYNNEEYVIVNSFGHIYEFVEPADMVKDSTLTEQYKSWDLGNLPWDEKDLTWQRQRSGTVKGEVFKELKATLSQCDEIAIATDVDPSGEGELLAWEILDELNLKPKKWSRFYFDDETPTSIQKAFKTRKTLASMTSDPDYIKAFFRARWDYLSIQFTRIATKAYDGRTVLRQGRLKSAMVELVGDQLKAISEYKKVPFYQMRFKDENGVTYINKNEPQYKSPEDVPNPYHSSGVVMDSRQKKATPPGKLLDLATLAAMLAAKGISADTTQKVYQKMYEDHVVSYPRTEDKQISPEQFNELLPLVSKIAKVVGIDTSLLTHRTPRPTHVKTGMSHGANRPGISVPESLNALESEYGIVGKMIYEILAKNYLAILAEDYIFEQQKGHVKDYPEFIGTTNVPLSQGYKAVFSADKDDSDEESAGLGKTADPFVFEGCNKKPETPTMKWLMKNLEKMDIGTGATRTSTYAEVTNGKSKTQLLVDTKGKITMAPCGEVSYKLLPGTHIGSLELTKQLQDEMKAVARGELNPEALLHNVQQLVKDDIVTMKKNASANNLQSAAAQSLEKASGTYKDGSNLTIYRNFYGHRLTDDELLALFQGGSIKVFGAKSKEGRVFNCLCKIVKDEEKKTVKVGIENFLDNDGNVSVTKEKNADEYYTGTFRKQQVSIKRVWSGHTFTEEELKLLFEGKEIEFEAKSQAKGTTFTAHGKLGTSTYMGHKSIQFVPDFSKKK